MMDPGDDVYLEHLLAMTREVTVRVPTSAGLCIDRQDMVGRLNPHADDGVTWFESASQNLTGKNYPQHQPSCLARPSRRASAPC